MNKVEIWKDITGYEGLYQVSNLGRVKSLNYNRTGKEKIMKTSIDKQGYIQISLRKDGKTYKFKVHRLVGFEFVDGFSEYKNHIDHINTIRTDNRPENLRWVSQKENNNNEITRSKRSKSMYGKTRGDEFKQRMSGSNNPSAKQVICITTGQVFGTGKEAGEFYNIHKTSIYNNLKGIYKYAGKLEDGTKLVWMYFNEYNKEVA